MKNIPTLMGVSLMSLLLGCATTPVALAPVGPNPTGHSDLTSNGQLEVFSVLVGRAEGNNPTWFQHTDYSIYDQNGKFVQRVANSAGRYARSPQLISLPPGNYLVKAEANDYLRVTVPAVIVSGRTTKIHLDDAWTPADHQNTELVSLPNGKPVGWALESK